MTQAQQEVSFAEVTPVQEVCSGKVAVTVRMAGAEAAIYSGADAATAVCTEAVFHQRSHAFLRLPAFF